MAQQFTASLTSIGRDGKQLPSEFPQAVRMAVHIDSRDRNFATHPSSSQFRLDLPHTLHNVNAAVLVSAELPLSYYVFSAARNNTSLLVAYNSVSQTVSIPDGNYTTTSMAAALKAALESAFPGATFTASFDPSTLKCSISAESGSLAVDTRGAPPQKFTEWGLGYFLGFPRNALVGGGSSRVTGTTIAQLNPENYLLLDIEELNGIPQCALYATGDTARRSFAKVPLNGDSYQYNYYDKSLTFVNTKHVISRLDSLRVAIRFHDGTLVDLNGAEWSMTIEFSCTQTRSPM